MKMRPTASGLLIPVRMNERPTHRCNYPGCDWVGYSSTEQVLHVKEHVREDEAEIVDATTPFTEKVMGEGYDPEHQAYLERRFRQLLPQIGVKAALDPQRY